MAVVQLCHDTDGRAYYRRKLAAGKSPMDAMRCLKRRLSNVIYQQMVNDAKATRTGPNTVVAVASDLKMFYCGGPSRRTR